MPEPALCGAKTRAGHPCRRNAMENGRCDMHGGKSTGPKRCNVAQNARKHGFYSDALTEEEKQLWHTAEVGTLDDEIRLMRVKLHRLVKLSGQQDVADLVDSAIEAAVEQGKHPKMGEFEKREIRVKASQYGELICVALDQLRKLELARKELNRQDDPSDKGDDTPIGKIVVEVVGAKSASAGDKGSSPDDDGAAGGVLPASG